METHVLDEARKRWVKDAYLMARQERLAQLRGRTLKRFDNYGMHPYSYAMGRIAELEALLELPQEERTHPIALRDEAYHDAHEILLKEIREGKEGIFHERREE